MFDPSSVQYLPETADLDAVITEIADQAFGPGRFARAAERVRELAPHDRTLSFVACYDGQVIGSVRLTPVAIGDSPALMLGPLAVRPAYSKRGIGKALMHHAAEAAREAGERLVFLVGDLSYYGPLGYRRLQPGAVVMPGPVDPARILALVLIEGAETEAAGPVRPRTSRWGARDRPGLALPPLN